MASKRLNSASLVVGTMAILLLFYGILTALVKQEQNQIMWDQDQISIEPRQLIMSNSSMNQTARRSLFPMDAFTLEQRQMGAVILHVLGIVYMFAALAIVCDEFFVPSLEVFVEKFKIPNDIAGATLMAAGGSTPEFFTSLFGIFFARNSIGFGTIVGSAVFNILLVIGLCGILARHPLKLTWWPLFRDTAFYVAALAVLIGFFQGGSIEWYESLVLIFLYVFYVLFMFINGRAERLAHKLMSRLKKFLSCKKHAQVAPLPPPPPPSPETEAHSEELTSAANQQHMYSTLMPLDTFGLGRKRLKSGDSGFHSPTELSRSSTSVALHHIPNHPPEHTKLTIPPVFFSQSVPISPRSGDKRDSISPSCEDSPAPVARSGDKRDSINPSCADSPAAPVARSGDKRESISPSCADSTAPMATNNQGVLNAPTIQIEQDTDTETLHENLEEKILQEENDESESERLVHIKPPKQWCKRILYVVFFPIIVLLFFTLPDVTKPRWKCLFPYVFIASILWIGGFSYLLVWWATVLGETAMIPPAVLGVTLLAAGTSVPDLITSVIVARKGRGDMAVSSSIGSNMFDITLGLPIPWLLFSAFNGGQAIEVFSTGLFCSVILLAGMLLVTVGFIALFRWKLSKPLGVVLFLCYIIFLTLEILLELVIECSIS